MDSNRIDYLLERYFAGDSSLADERELRAAFQSDALAERYPKAAALFRYQAAGKTRRLAPAAARATQARTFGVAASRRTLAVIPGYYWVLRIAAALLIGIAAFHWLDRAPSVAAFPIAETTQTVDWSKYEVTDPEEAARILSRSLRQMSGGMRSGLQTAGSELRKIKRLTDPVPAGSQ